MPRHGSLQSGRPPGGVAAPALALTGEGAGGANLTIIVKLNTMTQSLKMEIAVLLAQDLNILGKSLDSRVLNIF